MSKIGLKSGTLRNVQLQFVKTVEIEKAMEAAGKQYTFIVILTDKFSNRTQCTKLSTVEKVCGIKTNRPDISSADSADSADNILKKLNVKIGELTSQAYL